MNNKRTKNALSVGYKKMQRIMANIKYRPKCVTLLLIAAFSFLFIMFNGLGEMSVSFDNVFSGGASKLKRYVIYECDGRTLCGGLVDRFKGVMNAYAWALFTGRHLIVNISQPCYFSSLMVPNEVNWNLNLNELVRKGNLPRDFKLHEIRQLDNFGFKNELANMDVLNYQQEADVISLFTNLEWISAYARNL